MWPGFVAFGEAFSDFVYRFQLKVGMDGVIAYVPSRSRNVPQYLVLKRLYYMVRLEAAAELQSCIPSVQTDQIVVTYSSLQLARATFPRVHFFSAFSFLHPKFFGFRLAFRLWLFFSSKIIKKNRQKAKSWRKMKLLAFRFYHQNFFQFSAFRFLLPRFFSFWLLALGFRLRAGKLYDKT